MKIIKDTRTSRIITDNLDLLNDLIILYTFKIPGSEYSAAYIKGFWDGKKKFIDNKGYFPTGLIPKIVESCSKVGVDVIIEDNTTKSDYNLSPIEGFDYYDYQEKIINIALKQERGIVKAPTGAGKTLILAGLIKSFNYPKSVVLFTSKSLLNQTYNFLTKSCKMDNIGVCSGDGYIDGHIMLCMVQSIHKILDTYLLEAEALFVDECHEFCKGKHNLAAIESFPEAYIRLGFTATMPNETIYRYNLYGALGPTINVTNTKKLIEEGTLTKPLIQIAHYSDERIPIDMSYTIEYETTIIQNEIRNNSILRIAEAIRELNKVSKVLILVKNLEHGKRLKKLIGRNCYYLKGSDSIETRYETINKFRDNKETTFLIGTKILQTGINIEEITHFINARGLKSPIATIQALGRSLRLHETKDIVYVYDFYDKGKYLEKHSKKRISTYKSEGHTVEHFTHEN